MSDVPQTPPTPSAARGVFSSEALVLAERYASWLANAGVVRGLIGPREVPRLWDRHLLNCAVLAELIPDGASVADVGSGAGLPGLVLAIARPDLSMTLVEPLLRRTSFLDEVVADLRLANVEVVRGRAADLHGVRGFDLVTSRAVAPLARLLEWSMPLVVPTGALVVLKGVSAVSEVRDASSTLARFGCAEPVITELGAGVLSSTTTAVRVAWESPAQVSWPPVPTRQTKGAGSRNRGKGRPSKRRR